MQNALGILIISLLCCSTSTFSFNVRLLFIFDILTISLTNSLKKKNILLNKCRSIHGYVYIFSQTKTFHSHSFASSYVIDTTSAGHVVWPPLLRRLSIQELVEPLTLISLLRHEEVQSIINTLTFKQPRKWNLILYRHRKSSYIRYMTHLTYMSLNIQFFI